MSMEMLPEELDLSHLKPLADFDPIIYRAGFAADAQMKREYQLNYEEELDKDALLEGIQSMSYKGIALYNADEMVKSIFDKFKGEPQGYISGTDNYRVELATIKVYKGNRNPLHKPVYYKEIKQHLIDKWNGIVVTGQEADDALAQEQWRNKDKSTVICSIDKDLLFGVPGWTYDYVKHLTRYNTKAAADEFFFWQMLNGDSSDNIPGIKGVGPKTIEKLFDSVGHDLHEIRERVKGMYEKQYGPEWFAAYKEVGELLWIRRVEDQECPLL